MLSGEQRQGHTVKLTNTKSNFTVDWEDDNNRERKCSRIEGNAIDLEGGLRSVLPAQHPPVAVMVSSHTIVT